MAVDMFMKIGSVKGESLDKTHGGSIDVLAWSWGMSNSANAHMGGGSGAGRANVQDISFTKYIDLSSTSLMAACLTGKHFDTATLTVRKAGGTPLEYFVVEMTEVFISSYTTGGSGGEDKLTENVSLNFAKVKVTYTEQLATGAAGTKPFVSYDIQKNEETEG